MSLKYQCDRCEKTATARLPMHSEVPMLPENWNSIWGQDLCGPCTRAVEEVLKTKPARPA